MKRKIIKLTEAQYKQIISEDFISPDSSSHNLENTNSEVSADTPRDEDETIGITTGDKVSHMISANPGYLFGRPTYATTNE